MYQSFLSLVTAAALLSSCLGAFASESDVPDTSELIARYEAFVDGQQTIGYRSVESIFEKGGPFQDWTWTGMVDSFYARLGERWKLRYREIGYNYYDKHKIPFDLETETTFDGKNSVTVDRDDRRVRELSDIDQETARVRMQNTADGKIELHVSAEYEEKEPKAAREFAIQNATAVLFGYLQPDRLFVRDLLRAKTSRITTSVQMSNGKEYYVVGGATSHGTLSVWLDPVADFAPIRVQLHKSGNDLLNKTPMRLLKAAGDEKEPRPNLPLRERKFDVEYKLVSIGNRTGVSGYVRRDDQIYEGGASYSRRVDATLDGVHFDPRPDELEPSLSIPNETRVFIRNAPGLAAKWSDGKLVMGYDNPTVAAIDASKFSAPESRMSIWWICSLVSVLVVGIYLLIRWRRKKNSI